MDWLGGIIVYSESNEGGKEGTPVPEIDATGKVHGDLPNHVPADWTQGDKEQAADRQQLTRAMRYFELMMPDALYLCGIKMLMNEQVTAILTGTGNIVENFSYTYDVLGNVLTRADANESLTETFTYHTLNRVTSVTVSQRSPR